MNIIAVTDYLNNVGGAELSAQTIIRSLAGHPSVDDLVVVGIDLSDEEQLEYGSARVEPVRLPDFGRDVPDLVIDLVVERLLARRVQKYLEDADIVHAHHRRSTLALRHLPNDTTNIGTIRDYWPVCPISVYNVECEQCTGCGNQLDECVEYQGWTGMKGIAAKPYLLTKRQHYQNGLDPLNATVYIANHLRETVKSNYQGSNPFQDGVIYNPVSIEYDAGSEKKPDSPTYVTASSLVREKGVDLAIEAVGQLTESYPDASLRVFGDGPLKKELETLADETCPPNTISFEGRVPPNEVYHAMANATATVFPSRWAEPFGRVSVESLMLGTPVVGSDIGGIPEVVTDGATGLLFDVGSTESIINSLREIHESSDFQSKVDKWNESQRKRFTSESVADRYIKQFKSV
jgi:glycosyltransferase involved in cell wall biosynthesis